MKELIRQRFLDSIETKKKVIEDEALVSTIAATADAMAEVIANGGKILLCGNGGSASDALNIALTDVRDGYTVARQTSMTDPLNPRTDADYIFFTDDSSNTFANDDS